MSEYTGDNSSYPGAPTRDRLFTRWGQLKSERASWFAHWQELTSYILPRNGRYFRQDRDRGYRRHNNIYDSTGTRALRVLGAGMMSGATSPARQWFRLATPDPELNSYDPVKLWLDDVTKRMQRVFQKSNTYNALHQMYEELGTFGTASTILLPDYQSVIHHYPLTCGEYCISTDAKGRVCTLYREFEMTVSQVVKEFGLEKCSVSVQNMYHTGNLDQWVPVIHAIEPRADRDIGKRDAKNMPWGSYYFEVGGEEGVFLRESGFQYFPALCPRWSVIGGDIYGNSPGMEALGDIKQLQHEQLRKAQAIDYQTKPPLQVPASMKNRDVETLPGGVSYYDGQSNGIKTAFEVNLNLQYLLNDIQDCRERVRGAFYADMFLMLAGQPNTRMTATEVAERHEEKLLMLGPVLERLHNELLNPLIDITFDRMILAGVIPPAPAELQGMDLNVEFVSMLAQAQKLLGANTIHQFLGVAGNMASVQPDVLDGVDFDVALEKYADIVNLDPEIMRTKEARDAIRQQRAEAKAAQQAQETAMNAVQGAKTLSETDMTKNSALSQLTGSPQ